VVLIVGEVAAHATGAQPVRSCRNDGSRNLSPAFIRL
jgi:hypothetical protein